MRHVPFVPAFIGTGFGCGYWPWGPGTAGALAATAVWFILSLHVSAVSLFYGSLLFCIIATIAGTWAANKLQPYWGDDPSKIVIDEMIGVVIPLLNVPNGDVWYTLAALFLFRFFDILKPLGIRKLDNMQGGFYVMADDILAGIYSLVVINIMRWIV